jgi:putative FmdB family regulatory protein
MPTYTFQCDECGLVFNKHLKFNENKQKVTCPKNRHSKVHRVYNAPPIVFKGSGFYVTDNGVKHILNSSNGTAKNKEISPTTNSA